jgi:hypothetical protein
MEKGSKLGRFFVLCFVTSVVLSISPTNAGIAGYVENFATTQHKDAINTTAWWDTVAGELKLYPFELTLVGSYDTPSSATGVAITGDHICVADYGSGLQVIDISDPTTPTSAGSYDTPGQARAVAIAGDHAYVADYDFGLHVIDISDPTNPTSAGSYDKPNYARAIALAGDYAYLADQSAGLLVLDISDPANPDSAGSYDTPGSAFGVAVAGDHAYVADYGPGLVVLDIGNPTNPTLVGSYDTPGFAYDVAIAGDHAYVADYGAGLQVIDISDPTSPTLDGSYSTPGAAHGVAIAGDLAYVADYGSGLVALDISNPTSPALAGNYNTAGFAYGVAIAGEYAYVADENSGLKVIRVADPVLPIVLAATSGSGLANDVTIAGDYAYLANHYFGLMVVDITDPTNPTSAGNHRTPDRGRGVTVAGDHAYVADTSSGLQVIDISDPTNPDSVGSYDTSGQALAVAVAGDYAYVADWTFFLVMDISDPTNPDSVASYVTSGKVYDIAVAGDYAYVADEGSGLTVIDISDPLNPTLAGTRDTPGNSQGIAVQGDYAYLADSGVGGLQVIDISDPTNPTIAGSYDTPGEARTVTVAGDYAYVGDYHSGLQVIDISDPTDPTLAGSYDTDGQSLGIVAAGDYAFVADGQAGLQVFQVYQRQFDAENNAGQSMVLHESIAEIRRARLSAIHTDSIGWELSADSASNWEEVTSGTWHAFTSTGGDLLWKSTHVYAGGGINPACTNLTIDWLFDFATIDSIVDVPNDQGGWARVYFTRSGRDFVDELTYPITGYFIFRRIDDISLKTRILEEGESIEKQRVPALTSGNEAPLVPSSDNGSQVFILDGRYFLISSAAAGGLPPGTWEVVGSVPGHQEDQYICLVPTLADSSDNLAYSVYCISAETTTPSVYYFSPPDSGYSVDNLAPGAPAGLLYTLPGVVSWDEAPEPDFDYCTVYGSSSRRLVTAEPIGHTTGTNMDVQSTAYPFYLVTVTDFSGNRGARAWVRNPQVPVRGGKPKRRFGEEPGSLSGSEIPLALYPNYPNPFNPSTVIRFSLPKATHVSLTIFNLQGKRIQTLVDGALPGGFKEYRWDGRDAAGNPVSSGIYFYRLQAGGHTFTEKMAFLK